MPVDSPYLLILGVVKPLPGILVFQMPELAVDPLIDCLNCKDAEVLRVIALVLNVILIFPLIRALYVHFKTRGGFHLFYTVFIILILFTHLLYATGDVLANALQLYSNPFANRLLISIHAEVLAYQLVMLTFCLIERTVATVFRTVYERSLYWTIPLLAQIAAIVTIAALSMLSPLYMYFLLVIGHIVLIIALQILLKVNQTITENIVGKATLTTRYQVAENIRALRTIRPINYLEMFIIVIHFIYQVLESFDVIRRYCSLSVWLPRLLMFFVLQLAIPLVFMASHPAYRKFTYRFLRRRSKATVSVVYTATQITRDKGMPKVINVLGIDVVGGDQKYFDNLTKTWTRRF